MILKIEKTRKGLPMPNQRDEFNPKTRELLAKRASYICSNPNCRSLTLCASENDPEKYISAWRASHITAAARNGPRYDPSLTPEERASVDNGIFLCSFCADMIDKNKGLDFPVSLLKEWKREHETWIRTNLNKSPHSLITVIDGKHEAKGKGIVTGIDVQEPVFFKPGTKCTAEGEGKITATRISYRKNE